MNSNSNITTSGQLKLTDSEINYCLVARWNAKQVYIV